MGQQTKSKLALLLGDFSGSGHTPYSLKLCVLQCYRYDVLWCSQKLMVVLIVNQIEELHSSEFRRKSSAGIRDSEQLQTCVFV